MTVLAVTVVSMVCSPEYVDANRQEVPTEKQYVVDLRFVEVRPNGKEIQLAGPTLAVVANRVVPFRMGGKLAAPMGIADAELVAPLSQGTSVKLKIHRSKRGKLILDACLKCEQVVNQIDPKSSRVHSFDKAVRIIEPVTLGQKTVITMEKDSNDNPLSKFEFRVTEVDTRTRSARSSGEKELFLRGTLERR